MPSSTDLPSRRGSASEHDTGRPRRWIITPGSSIASSATWREKRSSPPIRSTFCAPIIRSGRARSIWRALATTNPDAALAALRRPKPFGSALGAMMRDHIELMRNRGYRYTTQATWCLRFDRYLQAHPDLASQPMEVMLESWRAARSTRNHAAECESLKAYWRRRCATKTRLSKPVGPTRSPCRKWRGNGAIRTSIPADVRRMLDLARSYPSPRAPLRPLSHLHHAVAGLLRGSAAERARPPRSG